jgi:tetratricopeptide (TPR) repeat protein
MAAREEKVIYDISVLSNANQSFSEITNNAKAMDSQIRETAKNLDRSFKGNTRTLSDFRQTSAYLRQSIRSLALDFAPVIAAIGAAVLAIKKLDEEFRRSIEATQKLHGVLMATGNIYATSTKELERMAVSLSRLTGREDEAIKTAQAMLLTFRGISKELYERSVKAVLDMSVIFGKLERSAVGVGKALEMLRFADLARRGVTFTEEQKKMIRTFKEAGDVFNAQRIILEAIEMQIKDTSVAMGETAVGSANKLRNSWKDLMQDMGASIGSVFKPLRDNITSFLNALVDSGRASKAFTEIMVDDLFKIGSAIDLNWVDKTIKAGNTVTQNIARIKDAIITLQTAMSNVVLLPMQRENMETQLEYLESALKAFEAQHAEELAILEAEDKRLDALSAMNKLITEAQENNRNNLEILQDQRKSVEDTIKEYAEMLKTATDPEIIATARNVINEYSKWARLLETKINKELKKIKPELSDQEKLLQELLKIYEKTPVAQIAAITDKIVGAQDLLTKGAGEYEVAIRGAIDALKDQLKTLKTTKVEMSDIQKLVSSRFAQTLIGQIRNVENTILDIVSEINKITGEKYETAFILGKEPFVDVAKLLGSTTDLKFQMDYMEDIFNNSNTGIQKHLVVLMELMKEWSTLQKSFNIKRKELAEMNLSTVDKINRSFERFRNRVDWLDYTFKSFTIDIKDNLYSASNNLYDVIKSLTDNLLLGENAILKRAARPLVDMFKIVEGSEAELDDSVIKRIQLEEDAWRKFIDGLWKNWSTRIKKSTVLIGNIFRTMGDALRKTISFVKEQGGIEGAFKALRGSSNNLTKVLGFAGQAAVVAAQSIFQWIKSLEVSQVLMGRFRGAMLEHAKMASERISPSLEHLARSAEKLAVTLVEAFVGSGEGFDKVIDRLALAVVGLAAFIERVIQILSGEVSLREANFRDFIRAAQTEFVAEGLALGNPPLAGVDNIFGPAGGGVSVRRPPTYNITINITFPGTVISTEGNEGLGDIIVRALQQAGLQGQNVNLLVTGGVAL